MNDTEIVNILQNDGIGVLPTDTVYGVVGRLFSEVAVQRIYKAKRHDPSRRVGTILIADISQIKNIVSPVLLQHASRYWPGPVSVVLPLHDRLRYAHGGNNTLAFRIPNAPELIELLQHTGPMATSSANLSGQPPAITIQQAKKYFGNNVDFYSDGGDLSGRQPSRIVELGLDGSEQEVRS